MEKRALIRNVNRLMSMEKLLEGMGSHVSPGGTLYCPFHSDTDRKSAKFWARDNSIYCYAEAKSYRPYDAAQVLGFTDEQMVSLVMQAQPDLSLDEKIQIDVTDIRTACQQRRITPHQATVEFLRRSGWQVQH